MADPGGHGEFYATTAQNITMHLAAVYDERELALEATCKEFLQVRHEGSREVRRTLKHYGLAAVLAVGHRVRSPRGRRFRQWAMARLEEYVVKGFTMDDERLKQRDGGAPSSHRATIARTRAPATRRLSDPRSG